MTASAGASSSPLSATVEQALFGYDNGHHLISTSTTFDSATLDLLNRVTDGTGAEAVRGFDGYLSGYPLPDGRYALSRTWVAPEAGRPGAVWTHLLIIDQRDLGKIPSPGALVDLFRRPTGQKPGARYTSRLHASGDAFHIGGPLRSDWTAALSALYQADKGMVWSFAETTHLAEEDLLRIWWWHWPALRGALSFTTGGLGRMSLGTGEFDILIVPSSREVSVSADLGVPNWEPTSAGTLVAADLSGDMPVSFGDFVRFCGAETRRRSAVSLLSDAWLVADDPGGRPEVALRHIANQICDRYPDPSSMRRLKRSIFMNADRLTNPWNASDQLQVLLEPAIAASVRQDDVRLPELLTAAANDPTSLIRAASIRSPSGRTASKKSGVRTVAEEVGRAATEALADVAQPSWLSEIVAASPTLAVSVLLEHPNFAPANWAREYWSLGSDSRRAIDADYSDLRRHKLAPSKSAPRQSLGWIAAYGPTTDDSLSWLYALHTDLKSRELAVVGLAKELTTCPPEIRRRYRACIRDEKLTELMLVKELRLFAGVEASLLTLLDPRMNSLRSAGVFPWATVVEANSDPVAAAHLLRIVPDHVRGDAEGRIAGQAFATVWNACASDNLDVWEALENYPAHLGGGLDWDRARRVSRRFAESLTTWSSEPNGKVIVQAALDAIAPISRRGLVQVEAEVQQALKPLKPPESTNQHRPQPDGWSPIDRARKLAGRLFGF